MLENYIGNKAMQGVYHKIINHIPKHSIYLELFAGSASIAKALQDVNASAGTVILNDLNCKVKEELKKLFAPPIQILSYDAIGFIQSLFSCNESFIFLDPPYLHETRNKNNYYEFEMSDEEHKKLLATVLAKDIKIMIIHPKCDLYDTYLRDWRKVEIKLRYQNKTSIECLYMNYPADLPLQSYAYLAKDCWDRQRIKRKADNMVKKLNELPILERNYILNEIRQNFGSYS